MSNNCGDIHDFAAEARTTHSACDERDRFNHGELTRMRRRSLQLSKRSGSVRFVRVAEINLKGS